MHFKIVLAFFILLWGNVICHSDSKDPSLELKLVQFLYRHGDRNPIDPYPTDPYGNESFWPEGYGQLTKLGKMQQYNLGKYIKEHCKDFLSPSYNPYEILIQSSSVDRAIASAESNLAGMYPPDNDISLWNPELKWQPIPVHNVPMEYDNKLKLSAPCPRYDQIYDEFLRSPLMIKYNKDKEEIYKYLTEKSGRSVKSPKDADFLYDVLFIESLHKYTLPEWTGKVFPDELRSMTEFSFETLTYTPEMKRLKGGPLLKEMIENMQKFIKGELDKRQKAFVYSGHDTTVAALLSTLDVFSPGQIIPYAVLVIVSLYQNPSDGSYAVKIEYRNNTNEEPYNLQLPNCDLPCPYEKFIQITKPRIPEDWAKECRASISSAFYDMIGWGMGLLLLGTGLLSITFIIIVFRAFLKGRRTAKLQQSATPRYPYLHLQMEDEEA